jgi:hypothetical protein
MTGAFCHTYRGLAVALVLKCCAPVDHPLVVFEVALQQYCRAINSPSTWQLLIRIPCCISVCFGFQLVCHGVLVVLLGVVLEVAQLLIGGKHPELRGR